MNVIKKYWGCLKGTNLNDVTKKDVLDKMDLLDKTTLSYARKNSILRFLFTPLKYAHRNELVDKDITEGIVFYAGRPKERKILTPELISTLFTIKWDDRRAKLANLLAMSCTR